MTILDATGKVFDWFFKNHSFGINNMQSLLNTGKDITLEEEAAVLGALDEMIGSGLLKKVDFQKEKKAVWILIKPLDQYTQTVQISSGLAQALATLVNNSIKSIEDADDRQVTPLAIKEKDIQTLIILYSTVLNSFNKIAEQEKK